MGIVLLSRYQLQMQGCRANGEGGLINTIFAHPHTGDLFSNSLCAGWVGGLLSLNILISLHSFSTVDWRILDTFRRARQLAYYAAQDIVQCKDDSPFLATASVNCALRFHVVINAQPSRSFKLSQKSSLESWRLLLYIKQVVFESMTFFAVLWIRIRIRRIHMFLCLPDPHHASASRTLLR